MYRNGHNAYRQTGVTTADPKKLILMCYDEAIGSLKIAKEKYLSGDFEDKAMAIQRAQDFIAELNRALDFERGGDIARNLHDLYNFMARHVMEGDLKRNMKAFDDVVGMLEELKSAWEEVFQGKADQPHQVEPLPHLSPNKYQKVSAVVG